MRFRNLVVLVLAGVFCSMSCASVFAEKTTSLTQPVKGTGECFRETSVHFYPFFDGGNFSRGAGDIFHVSVLKVPFCKAWNLSSLENVFIPDENQNPFGLQEPKENLTSAFMEQPLFCAYNEVDIATTGSLFAWRTRLLDTPLVRLWEREDWGKGKYHHWKFLGNQPFVVLEHEKSPAKTAVSVLNVAELLGVFLDYTDGKKQETRFLPILEGGVWGTKKTERENRTYCMHTMLASVWESKEEKGKQEWSVLSTPVCSVVGGWKKDDASLKYVLRLPLIGPVWAVWDSKGTDGSAGAQAAPFPRLLFWKKYPDRDCGLGILK